MTVEAASSAVKTNFNTCDSGAFCRISSYVPHVKTAQGEKESLVKPRFECTVNFSILCRQMMRENGV